MSTKTKLKQKKSRNLAPRALALHKPRGKLHPRVEAVGPQRFGVVAVDPANQRSDWMLADFYGKVLVEPMSVDHTRGGLQLALERLRAAVQEHALADLVVAIERTGNYHRPVQQAYSAAGFECRIVHPFATKQFRLPADPGTKTDDTDLAAIHRAAVNGFGLMELPLDPPFSQMQLLARHRRDLVEKRSALYCQMRERLEAFLPGYARCFHDLWESSLALRIPRQFDTPEGIRQAGVAGVAKRLAADKVVFQKRSLERILAWTGMAPPPRPDAALQQRMFRELDDDRTAKTGQIEALERDLASVLAQTPYVLLLSHPGINVVSAAELAGEMGPISHYAKANSITGRAGLFPARYQSSDVDRIDGRLVRCANRRLRAALLMIGGNLVVCNAHFRARAELWARQGKDPERIRIMAASRFARIAYHLVAGRTVFQHPCCQGRDYVLDKLLQFHREHETPMQQMLADLQHAVEQLPSHAHRGEAAELTKILESTRSVSRRGPKPIGDILPLVLAKLGAGNLQSKASGDVDPS
jgi:transposase